MTGAKRSGQALPSDSIDLSTFPSTELSGGETLYRAHSAQNGPGWFASDDQGRFNLRSPNGTAYVGERIDLVIRERFGTILYSTGLTSTDVSGFMVSVISGISGVFADMTTSKAASHGVTIELTAMQPYEIPQAWAEGLHSAGFDGIRYLPRFTPGQDAALAVFGNTGVNPLGTTVREMDGSTACKEAGIRVIMKPPDSPDSLTLI